MMKRLHYILLVSDTARMELMLALASISWGVFMWIKADVLHTLPVYTAFIDWASGYAWSVIFVAAGLYSLIGVMLDFTRMRATGGAASLFLWAFTVAALWLSNGYNTGTVIYSLFAAFSFLILVRHARRAGGAQS